MDNTVLAVAITAFPSILAGAAAIITAVNNRRNNVEDLKKDVRSIKDDIHCCKSDISVTKEASFYALQAHVENGVNGDVRKAHERLKVNIFNDGN